jgi:hypothetical protein
LPADCVSATAALGHHSSTHLAIVCQCRQLRPFALAHRELLEHGPAERLLRSASDVRGSSCSGGGASSCEASAGDEADGVNCPLPLPLLLAADWWLSECRCGGRLRGA